MRKQEAEHHARPRGAGSAAFGPSGGLPCSNSPIARMQPHDASGA